METADDRDTTNYYERRPWLVTTSNTNLEPSSLLRRR